MRSVIILLLKAKYTPSQDRYNGFIFRFFQTDLNLWRIVFQLASVIGISTYFSFQIFGTGEVQPWNYPDGVSRSEGTREKSLLNSDPKPETTTTTP